MAVTAAFEKVSLTIDADVLASVRGRVQRGGLSAYATEALRRQLERDGLSDLVGELVEANGPMDEAEIERHAAEFR